MPFPLNLKILFSEEPTWHLILGGYCKGRLNSVELYNWQTGEICQLANLTIPINSQSATVLDGFPIYCGGYFGTAGWTSDRCFKFDKAARDWTEVSKCVFSFRVIIGRFFLNKLFDKIFYTFDEFFVC